MKINTTQLNIILKRGLSPCYLIIGNDPLLIDETVTTIRETAKTQQYYNREYFDLAPGFNWQLIERTLKHDSLFGEKKLIELNLGHHALPPLLKSLIENDTEHANRILLIRCDKLTLNQQKSKWYGHINKIGVIILVKPLTLAMLPHFITQKLRQVGFKTSKDAINTIVEHNEGNPLAISQLVKKLALLFEPGTLQLDQIKQVLQSQAHFDVFALGDSALRGEGHRCYTIIKQLQHQGIESPLVLGAISRDIRLLLSLIDGINSDIWPSRQPLYKTCLSRVNKPLLYYLLQQAAKTDRIIKGIETGKVWDQLLSIALKLALA